jgi:hypothetical protein
MKLIVVGNGPIRYYQGHQINLFDTVVRCGAYKIANYEPLVGTKTDIASVARVEQYDPLPPIIWMANPMGFCEIPLKITQNAYPNGWKEIDTPLFDKVYQACGFLDKEGNRASHPTLGLLTIFMAIEYAKFFYTLPITITGFSFCHPGKEIYYFDKTPQKEVEKSIHDYTAERNVVKLLIEEGLVQYLHKADIDLLDGDCDYDFRDA